METKAVKEREQQIERELTIIKTENRLLLNENEGLKFKLKDAKEKFKVKISECFKDIELREMQIETL
jgi:hypothetical protein